MASAKFSGFQPHLFRFLDELTNNNERDWFQANKSRYESDVLEPSLEFIRAFAPRLQKISPMFTASDRRVGGSLMRIYRDTRFAKDKTPYKTNVGIHFRHEMGGDVHAPGFYVHLAPDECFLGAGIWHPDSKSLALIRRAIDEDSTAWKRARDSKAFTAEFKLAGDSLKTNPRGYAKDHPLIDDLRRKDFIAVRPLTQKQVLDTKFVDQVAASLKTTRSLMRFLCSAIGVPF